MSPQVYQVDYQQRLHSEAVNSVQYLTGFRAHPVSQDVVSSRYELEALNELVRDNIMRQKSCYFSSEVTVERNVKVQSLALRAMLLDLEALENDTSFYDEDCIKPSQYAFARLRDLLTQTATDKRFAFPFGVVYPDGSGALRVEWMRQGREVTLVIYPKREDRHYIFHKQGEKYGGDYNVTPEKLGFYLEHLSNDERTAK